MINVILTEPSEQSFVLLFFKEFTLFDVITLVIALAAFFVSMYAIKNDNKNLSKELKLNKFEEIYEIVMYFKSTYSLIYDKYYENIEKTDYKYNNIYQEVLDYNNFISGMYDDITYQRLMKYCDRIYILNSSYVNNIELKKDIFCLGDLVQKVATFAYTENKAGIKNIYEKFIPTQHNFFVTCESIEERLIKELKMNSNYIFFDDVLEYRSKVFIPKLDK